VIGYQYFGNRGEKRKGHFKKEHLAQNQQCYKKILFFYSILRHVIKISMLRHYTMLSKNPDEFTIFGSSFKATCY